MNSMLLALSFTLASLSSVPGFAGAPDGRLPRLGWQVTAAESTPQPPSAPEPTGAPDATQPQAQAPAQEPASQGGAVVEGEQIPPVLEESSDDDARRREGRGTVRFGEDFVLPAGQTADEVVVIGGSATIDGRVNGELVVIGGSATVGSRGVVAGDFVVVGGSATLAPGAVLARDMVVVGGALEAPPDFQPGGERVVVGLGMLGVRLEPLRQWFTRGLLWGRLFVPDLGWLWGVAGVVFLLYLLVAFAFDGPVRQCVARLETKPVTAFLVGLLVLLLLGPVTFLLLVSVVGIVIVPFVVIALFVAALVGRVAVAEWVGLQILRPASAESRKTALLAFTLGFAVVCLTYMVPVIGLLIWALIGVLGLGAVAIALADAYRHENPRPAPDAGIPPPVPAVPLFPPRGETPSAPDAGAYPGGVTIAGLGAPAAAAALVMMPRAAFLERLAAFVLDGLLVMLLTAPVRDDAPGPPVFLVLFTAYRIGAWAWKGATVGGIICRLRVTRVDGAPLQVADAFVRGLTSIFSIIVLGLGCFWVLRDEERQAWHDRVAGTYVVKVPRNFPL